MTDDMVFAFFYGHYSFFKINVVLLSSHLVPKDLNGPRAKMGMQCESATLPDAVCPFIWAVQLTTGKTSIPGKVCCQKDKSEDLPNMQDI